MTNGAQINPIPVGIKSIDFQYETNHYHIKDVYIGLIEPHNKFKNYFNENTYFRNNRI